MDTRLSCELIVQSFGRQPASGGTRAQLYLTIRQAILEHRLDPGTALPASRQLAAELGIGRNTVVRAYDQLLVEGYLESKTDPAPSSPRQSATPRYRCARNA